MTRPSVLPLTLLRSWCRSQGTFEMEANLNIFLHDVILLLSVSGLTDAFTSTPSALEVVKTCLRAFGRAWTETFY